MAAPRYLLDTNIIIYVLSGRYPALRSHIDRLAPGRVATSVMVCGELHYGIAKSERREDALQRLRALLELVPELPLPANVAEHYGDIRAALSTRGKPIGANDLWIAAHARAAHLTLVTNNVREFERVDGLKLENWTA
ncbi:MAG: type II toxin-antitoxin system VapC family toxin [Rhodanobacter sp.]